MLRVGRLAPVARVAEGLPCRPRLANTVLEVAVGARVERRPHWVPCPVGLARAPGCAHLVLGGGGRGVHFAPASEFPHVTSSPTAPSRALLVALRCLARLCGNQQGHPHLSASWMVL